jgi:hypothetical protein
MSAGSDFALDSLATVLKQHPDLELLQDWSVECAPADDGMVHVRLTHPLSAGLDFVCRTGSDNPDRIEQIEFEQLRSFLSTSAEVAYCASAPASATPNLVVDIRTLGAFHNLPQPTWTSLLGVLADHGCLELEIASWLAADWHRKPGSPSRLSD